MIESSPRGVLRKTYGRSSIGLGIAVDEKGGLFGNSEAGSQVHGCSGLSDPALLICYGDNSSQIISPSENLTKRVAGCKLLHVERLAWLVLNLAVTIRGNVPRETWGLLQDYCSA